MRRWLRIAAFAQTLGIVAGVLGFAPDAAALCQVPMWADFDTTPPALTQYKLYFSPTIGQEASYLIYLPPSYNQAGTKRFPVLYWLHGGGGTQKGGADFVTFLDDAIRRGASPEFIVVLPNGPDTLWTDSNPGKTPYDAPIETVIIDDLIPHVEATYLASARREHRGVEGFSMGGRGSSRLGLKYPDKFSVVSNLSGAVQTEEEFWRTEDVYTCVYGADSAYYLATDPYTHASDNAAWIRSLSPYRLRIVVGELDFGTHRANLDFDAHLSTLGIVHTLSVVPGVAHSYKDLYETQGDSMFQLFVDAWGPGAVPNPPADAVPPSVPAGLAAVATSSRRVDLSWGPSTDNVGVSGYHVFRDGALVATVTAPSYADTRLPGKRAYTYAVTAFDGAGNESASSVSVRVRGLGR